MFDYPVQLLLTNLGAAFAGLLGQNFLNVFWQGETQLVIRQLSVDRQPERAETPYVQISGRRGGLFGYLITLLNPNANVSLSAYSTEIRKTTVHLTGRTTEVLPLHQDLSVIADAHRSMFALWIGIANIVFGAGMGLLGGDGVMGKMTNMLAAMVFAVVWFAVFYVSYKLQIGVQGTVGCRVSFRPNLIEGRKVDFDSVMNATELILDLIHQVREESRQVQIEMPISGAPAAPQPTIAQPPPIAPQQPPPSAPVQPPPPLDPYAGQTPLTPSSEVSFGPNAPVAGEQEESPPPSPSETAPFGTGTMQWEGGMEPGTSESLVFQKNVSRPQKTKSYAAMPETADYVESDDEEADLEEARPSSTVSWEEQEESSSDEMRAQAELKELRESRPKRGEAKLRLRELIRRYPATQASTTARRMLEKLESGN